MNIRVGRPKGDTSQRLHLSTPTVPECLDTGAAYLLTYPGHTRDDYLYKRNDKPLLALMTSQHYVNSQDNNCYLQGFNWGCLMVAF